MFRPVNASINPILLEEKILNYWRLHRTFAKSSERNVGSTEYVLYDQPVLAINKPGLEEIHPRIIKDFYSRYKSMRGYHVLRRGGWNAHGLPIEFAVEKQLGLQNQKGIDTLGIELFNHTCKKLSLENIKDWERFLSRLGYWTDFEEAFVSYTNDYIETVWWVIRNLWDRGLIYQAYKVLPYCPRCGTSLSSHEAISGSRRIEEHSIYFRLPLVDEPNTSLLVWSLAPWTLPANIAVAAHPNIEYVVIERPIVEGGRERLIIAHTLVENIFCDERIKIVDSFKGRKLKGKHYQPVFTFQRPNKPAHFIVLQENIPFEQGTGLINISPAFDASAMQTALEHDLPILIVAANDGTFLPEIRPWSGTFVKDANPRIIQDLEGRGLLFRQESIELDNSFCWVCDTPLLNFPRLSWFLKTGQSIDKLKSQELQVNWLPSPGKNEILENWSKLDPDWAISRERFWGTPLPIWECNHCHHQIVMGSIESLSKLVGRDLNNLDLHRPYIDQISFACPECNHDSRRDIRKLPGQSSSGMMVRNHEVLDVWFELGCMPLAQWHFPFENREEFRNHFPADLVCDLLDPVGGWYYSLQILNTILSDNTAFNTAICLMHTGLVFNNKALFPQSGKGNTFDIINSNGIDVLRWYYLASYENTQDLTDLITAGKEVLQGEISLLWDVYEFFVACANHTHWSPQPKLPLLFIEEDLEKKNILDEWLISELHYLIREITEALDSYDTFQFTQLIKEFINKMACWYLPYTEKQILFNKQPGNKESTYKTLYQSLLVVCKLIAPAMPFLAEDLYQNLARAVDPHTAESVHLNDWPGYNPEKIDLKMNEDFRQMMHMVSLSKDARENAGLNSLQPVQEVVLLFSHPIEQRVFDNYSDFLREALNTKQLRFITSSQEMYDYQVQPKADQLEQLFQASLEQIEQAINRLNPVQIVPELQKGHSLRVDVDGNVLEIPSDALEFQISTKEGFSISRDNDNLVALSTTLPLNLVQEGLVNESISKIQDLRRKRGFGITEPILIYLNATPELLEGIRIYEQKFLGENVASMVVYDDLQDDSHPEDFWFGKHWMKVGLTKDEAEFLEQEPE